MSHTATLLHKQELTNQLNRFLFLASYNIRPGNGVGLFW